MIINVFSSDGWDDEDDSRLDTMLQMIQDADSDDEEEDTDDGIFMEQELEDEEEQPGIQCNIYYTATPH